MKKFLKVFIMVLLVLAVIGGTVFFFFRKLERENSNTGSIVAMLESDSVINLREDLIVVSNKMGSADERMKVIIKTNDNLNDIVYVLSSYFVDNGTEINNKNISNQLKELNASRNVLNRMIDEYILKDNMAKPGLFDNSVGANDLYLQSCDYISKFASFAGMMNSFVSLTEKGSDFKFNMFEIYCNIAMTVFKDVDKESILYNVEYEENISKINEIFKIENSQISAVNLFSVYTNEFNKYYAKSNKDVFARDFELNFRSVENAEQSTNEEIAIYYLKQIFGK